MDYLIGIAASGRITGFHYKSHWIERKDEDQEFIYLADGSNMQVHILDRESLEHLYSFGDGGRMPGLFFGTHSIATDSDGNIYTTETYEGKRTQKFVFQGMASLSQIQDGAPWPSSSRL